MPRKASPRSLLAPLHRQVTNAVAALREEIAQREKQLADLKTEMARWQKVANHRVGTAQPRAAKSTRVDWGALLRELPARFTTREAAEKVSKSLTHVYAAVSRWMKDKKITKDKHGYRKISGARS